jgi:Cellulase (glycosyl hydrolase family 5)
MRAVLRHFPARLSGVAAIMILSGYDIPAADSTTTTARWSAEKARTWAADKPWFAGCNYYPANAINQLEMWQKETFDPVVIDRELGWAEDIGFNSVRVYLHDIMWKEDRKGFLERTEKFLEIAHSHGIGVVFVIFDSCWDPNPKPGKQREPQPGLHNAGWLQSPGREILADEKKQDALEGYVKGFITHYRNDKRVHMWDLFNEPDNTNDNSYKDQPEKVEQARQLLEKTFRWATEVDPSQPLTSAVWRNQWRDSEKLTPMEKLQLDKSEVITFHNYGSLEQLTTCVESLRQYERPIFCTEYMARGNGSKFDPNLGYLKDQKVGAYNWGFVAGKSQTIYPWDSWKKKYDSEPAVWFHDIFRADGSPYIPAEVEYIRSVTGKKPSGGKQ